MPKKDTATKPKPAPEVPPWNLPEPILAAAAAGEEEDLAQLLVRQGFGGRPQADLLVSAVTVWRKYRPAADSLPGLIEELAPAERHLEALKKYQPGSTQDCREYSETLHEVTRLCSRLNNEKSQAERAAEFCKALANIFNRNATGRYPGPCPPELEPWFKAHDANPDRGNSWMDATSAPESRPIVAQPAAVNIIQGE